MTVDVRSGKEIVKLYRLIYSYYVVLKDVMKFTQIEDTCWMFDLYLQHIDRYLISYNRKEILSINIKSNVLQVVVECLLDICVLIWYKSNLY